MRKTFSGPVLISSVLFVVVTMAVTLVYRGRFTVNRPAAPNQIGISVFTVLQAHGGHTELPTFTQTGTLIYHPEISAGSQGVFERQLTLYVNGRYVRYDKTTLNRTQSYLFDGSTLIRTTFDAESRVESRVIDGSDAVSIKNQMATFGLLPILKRLSEPNTQVVYAGRTSTETRFEVKSVGGSWYFYSNSNNLIERVEVNSAIITFGDYRTVEGLTLPFSQQVKKGDKLLYEIKLDTFDLNPVFARGFFKSDPL